MSDSPISVSADALVAAVRDRPLVSVIIPIYNRADVLGETIESVFAQTYPNIELICVDDGSKDDTQSVLARYADRLINVRQSNQGLAAARNNGFARAKGKYIAWLDHDDVWLPEKLSLQISFMEANPDVVLTATDFSAFDAEGYFEPSHAASYYAAIARDGLGNIFTERVAFEPRAVPELDGRVDVLPSISVWVGRIYEKLIWGNCMHPPTAVMTREAHAKAGVCDGRFGNAVDYEFLMRVSKHGRSAFIDHPLMRYRYSEGQLSADANLAKIALSLITTLEALAEREPDLRHNLRFRRRVAMAHQSAANALADQKRAQAIKHLVHSIRGGLIDANTATTLLKALLPRSMIELCRAIAHRTKNRHPPAQAPGASGTESPKVA
jgi:glycosyltransferase involved in cell wall biosynthesis